MKQFKKISVGFVVQNYEDGNCVSQEFIAGDQIDYEDQFGDAIEPQDENYQPFEMVQPQQVNKTPDKIEIEIDVEGGLISSINIPKGNKNIVVVVKDYDTDGADETEEDKNGEFVRTEWRNR